MSEAGLAKTLTERVMDLAHRYAVAVGRGMLDGPGPADAARFYLRAAVESVCRVAAESPSVHSLTLPDPAALAPASPARSCLWHSDCDAADRALRPGVAPSHPPMPRPAAPATPTRDPAFWTYQPGTFEARCSCPRHPDAPMRRFGDLARCSECGDAVNLCYETLGSKECVREKGHPPDMHTSKSGTSWSAPAPPGDARTPAYDYTAAYASKGGEIVHAVRAECSMTAECAADVTKIHGVAFDRSSAFACRNCLRAIARREGSPSPASDPEPEKE